MVISRSSERTKLQNALRDTDTVIATTNQSIRHSTRSIEMLNRRINNLEAEAVSLERDIASRQSQLERALGAFSILNQGGDLKILLGDSGAHETERHRAYFDILLREQLAEINAFKAAISTLDANQKEQEVIRADQEQEHIEKFNELLVEKRVRPTALVPLWNVAGFALGAGTALMGEKAAMACTVAVEKVIGEHYREQQDLLKEDEKELKKTIAKFEKDELEHHDIGLEHDAENAPGYKIMTKVIEIGCKTAIAISKKI